jgi:hypothetical protein
VEEHKFHLRQVLDQLEWNSLENNAEERVFDRGSLEFLGHIVKADGFSPLPGWVTTIQEWQTADHPECFYVFTCLSMQWGSRPKATNWLTYSPYSQPHPKFSSGPGSYPVLGACRRTNFFRSGQRVPLILLRGGE